MEIALIVISSLVLIALIALIVVLIKRKPKNDNGESKENAAVREANIINSVSSLKSELPLLVKNSVTAEMANINKELGENGVKNQQALINFQDKLDKKLDEKIESLNKKVDTNLTEIREKVDKSLKDGFKDSSDTMNQLQKALNDVNKAQENIQKLSGDVVSLKQVLNNNQGRGRFGEIQLEMLLAAMFGESNKGLLYDVQYKLTESLKPDAVVFMDGEPDGSAILCIDSKFAIHGYDALFDSSVELNNEEKDAMKKSFKSALKIQIDQVAKYVIDGKTVNTAIMFIPNDGIFAFIENEYKDLADYARSKAVVMTCPTIIQPLIAALRVIQNDSRKNKNLAKINDALTSLAKDFKNFGLRWDSLEKTIGTLQTKTSNFGTTVRKIDSKFNKISIGKTDDQIDIDEDDIKEIEG